jgi:phospholipid transport system substrate-binding protein
MKHRIGLTVAVVVLCWGVAWAGSPTEELSGFFAAAKGILQDSAFAGGPEERLAAIRALAHQMFDVRGAARLALGPDWNERSPAEREQFVGLFSDLLARSFIAGIAGRIHIADDVKVRFVGESRDGDAASVRTTMVARNGHDLPLDYRMVQLGGRWVVTDVAIDGVGLTANYRAQFARVLQSAPYPELVKQMRDRASPSVAAMVAAAGPARPVAPGRVDVAGIAPAPRAVAPAASQAELTPPAAQAPHAVQPARIGDRADARVPAAPETTPPITPVPVRREPATRVSVPVAVTRGEPEPIAPPPSVTAVPAPSAKAPSVPPASAPANAPVPVASAPGTHPSPASVPARGAAPAPAVNRSSSLATAYWVQVAAFKNLEAALRLAAALQEEGAVALDRWAVMMEPGGEAWARVRVGPFADRTAAAASARDLAARGYKPFIAEDRRSAR